MERKISYKISIFAYYNSKKRKPVNFSLQQNFSSHYFFYLKIELTSSVTSNLCVKQNYKYFACQIIGQSQPMSSNA